MVLCSVIEILSIPFLLFPELLNSKLGSSGMSVGCDCCKC